MLKFDYNKKTNLSSLWKKKWLMSVVDETNYYTYKYKKNIQF